MSGDAIGSVPRPQGVAHRRQVFAVEMDGATMTPWRKPRELVYADPDQRPLVGDHVIVELKATAPDGARFCYVKKLIAATTTKVRLAQYEPAAEVEYKRSQVHRIYRVMEWPEVLGVRTS